MILNLGLVFHNFIKKQEILNVVYKQQKKGFKMQILKKYKTENCLNCGLNCQNYINKKVNLDNAIKFYIKHRKSTIKWLKTILIYGLDGQKCCLSNIIIRML